MSLRLTSLSRNVAKVGIVLAAAVALALSVAASARADANVSVSFDGHIRALATFIAWGDEFKICDMRRDNLPVGVRYSYVRKNGTTQRGGHWHYAGVDGRGEPDSGGFREQGCSYGDHDFAEGRRVWFQACVTQPEGQLTCGNTQVTGTGPK
jgi:hypothetical protein